MFRDISKCFYTSRFPAEPHKVYSLINVIKKQNINTSVVTPRLIHSYMTKDLTKTQQQ